MLVGIVRGDGEARAQGCGADGEHCQASGRGGIMWAMDLSLDGLVNVVEEVPQMKYSTKSNHQQ